MKKTLLAVIFCCAYLYSDAQSVNFSIGKGIETECSILQSVAKCYVDTVDYEKMIAKGIAEMLSTLDPYTVYFPEDEEESFEMMTTGMYGGIGALIKKRPEGYVLITQPYENTPATKNNILPGDQIISIDGVSVIGETSEQSSNKMKGQPGTDVLFTIIKGRSKDTVDIKVTRERIHVSDIQYAGMIKDSIGYIKVTGFTEKVSDEFKEKFISLKKEGAKKLIIDLRDNGGGIMDEAVKIVSMFVPKGTLVLSSKGRVPEMNQTYITTESPVDTLLPVLVMVNSSSASASEITAGALQDLDRAVIAGKRTFGKGLIQSIFPAPYQGKVKITTGKYYTPSGRCVQAIDYSHRNEDGSVGNVPDSLKKEFKTIGGRSVYDGGGITPDIEVEAHKYSRTAISLVYNDIIGEYAVEYFNTHEAIASPEEFTFSDDDYEDFISYASTKEFDARSSVEAALDELIRAAEKEGVYEQRKDDINLLASKIRMDKPTLLRNQKEEIIPLLEEEISNKFHLKGRSTIVALKYDTQLENALQKWNQDILLKK